MKIAIVAFGDTSQGDNGIGIEIISHLKRRDLPGHAVIFDGATAVSKTLERISNFDGLIIIDAASMGEPPGTVKSFNLNSLLLGDATSRITLHGINMDSELLYAYKFLSLPPTIIVGIEPKSLKGSAISGALLSNLNGYIDAVIGAMDQLCP